MKWKKKKGRIGQKKMMWNTKLTVRYSVQKKCHKTNFEFYCWLTDTAKKEKKNKQKNEGWMRSCSWVLCSLDHKICEDFCFSPSHLALI